MLSTGVAYLLWFGGAFFLCGLHRIYAGKPVSGFIWLITFGLLGIGQFIDLFLIPSMVYEFNAKNGFHLYGRNVNKNTVIVNVIGNGNSSPSRNSGPETDFDF